MSCPRPSKIRYATEGEAIKYLRRMPRSKSRDNVPYRCDDHWHVGRVIRQTKKVKR